MANNASSSSINNNNVYQDTARRQNLVMLMDDIWTNPSKKGEITQDYKHPYNYGHVRNSPLVSAVIGDDAKLTAIKLLGTKLDDMMSLFFEEELLRSQLAEDYKIERILELFDQTALTQDDITSRDLQEYKQLNEAIAKFDKWKLEELSILINERMQEIEREKELKKKQASSDALKREGSISGRKGWKSLLQEIQTTDNKSSKSKGINIFKRQPNAPVIIDPIILEDTPQLTWDRVLPEDLELVALLIAKPDEYLAECGKNYTGDWIQVNKAYRVEEKWLDEYFYRKYFVGCEHSNWLASDATAGPICVSIEHDTKDRDYFLLYLRSQLGDTRYRVSPNSRPKDIIKQLKLTHPGLTNVKFERIRNPALEKDLIKIERDQVTTHYKFGILLCKEGQVDERDMFCNENPTDDFQEFLDFIGKKVRLNGFTEFRGGLDVKSDTTGTHSIYITMHGYEIMFHVSTMLPFFPQDAQQLERKRHIGNDVTTIVFKEGDQPFSPDCISSEFLHVFIVVQKMDPADDGTTQYRVEVVTKDSVKRPFRPLLPSPPVFKKGGEFRAFLLTKLINSERAAMSSKQFALKIKRTRKILLSSLISDFCKKKQESS